VALALLLLQVTVVTAIERFSMALHRAQADLLLSYVYFQEGAGSPAPARACANIKIERASRGLENANKDTKLQILVPFPLKGSMSFILFSGTSSINEHFFPLCWAEMGPFQWPQLS
jgi:hypothetical protein